MATLLNSDANDCVYQWNAPRDYNPEPKLDHIRAHALAINAAEGERNPPETGITEAAMKKIANARLRLLTASAETTGHGTTGDARLYAKDPGEGSRRRCRSGD